MPRNPAGLAQKLAIELDARQIDYAIGSALALGFWGEPRGTLDVDITLFVSPAKPANCVNLLLDIHCDLEPAGALDSLSEHGFCKVALEGTTVDVFLPIVDFYETARLRRQSVRLGRQNIWIGDAESLVKQILRQRGDHLERQFVRNELVMLYGQRDPRLGAWDDLTSEQ